MSNLVLTGDLGLQMRNVDFSGTECGKAYAYTRGDRRCVAVECGEHVVVLSEAQAIAVAAEVGEPRA